MRGKSLAIVCVVLCGMAMQALADGVKFTPVPSKKNSFYIGIDAGAADLMNKESHSVNPESHNLGVIGPVAGAYAGYDFGIVSQFRAAVEIFLDVTDLQTRIVHDNNTYRMYQYYNTGIRLLPAYVFEPQTTAHLIFGYANGRFKIKDNGVYGLVSDSYNSGGYQVGMGFDTQLQEHFFVRLDALYNSYGSTTKQGTGLTGAGSTQSYTNRFSQLAGELSLYYRFVC